MTKITVDEIMKAVDSPMFFGWKELKPIIDKNKGMIFLNSERSVGKSTAIACYVLADYVANGARFLYMRRTDRVLYETRKTFFDDAVQLINEAGLGFQIVYFSCEAGKYMMTVNWDDEDYKVEKYNASGDLVDMSPEEEQEAIQHDIKERAENVGGCLSVKAYEHAKSGFDKHDIKHFIYDEYIAEQTTDYLGTADNDTVEWDDMMSIYMSIAREKGNPFKNDVDIFFLGNKAHDYNPILLMAGVNTYLAQSPDAKIISPKDEEWVYVNIQTTEAFKKAQKASRAYRMMKHDKRLQQYNFENKAKDSTEVFDTIIIKEMPKGAYYQQGFALNGKQYGLYYRERDGLIYIGKYQPGKYTEALDLGAYCNGDTIRLVKSWRDSGALSAIYEAFLRKKCKFMDRQTAMTFLQYLDFIPR